MAQRIWLSWESQRRNRTLSAALGARLYELDYPLSRARRWAIAIRATLRILLRERPRLLFAQNPSLLLALISVWYGRLSGRPVIIDAHNAGVFPLQGREGPGQAALRWLAGYLARHVMRLARYTIVSNPALAAYVEGADGHSVVLPDPLPSFADSLPPLHSDGPSVLFICTWAEDEPYLEVLEAARRIDSRIRIYITGNSKGREKALDQPLPANVVLTGFVPEERFVDLLRAADLVMDLTTLEDCLVCGAYEAVALAKPMVLSDTAALRSYFRQGAVFTRNDAAAIAQAIEHAVANRDELGRLSAALKRDLTESWRRRQIAFETLLTDTVEPMAAGSTVR